MPSTQFDVWDGNSMPRGLAPKTNLWARNLRSSAENSPRQSLPPPLEHMKWPMAQAAEKARAPKRVERKPRSAAALARIAPAEEDEKARVPRRVVHKALRAAAQARIARPTASAEYLKGSAGRSPALEL